MPRRNNTGLAEDLFEMLEFVFRFVPPWVSIPVGAIGGFLIWFFFPRFKGGLASLNSMMNMVALLLGGFFAAVCLLAGLKGWLNRKRKQNFPNEKIDISWLNKLTWQEFEHQVAEVYRQKGFDVEETGGGGSDGGIDLILYRGTRKFVVQCKRWKTYKVGVQSIRELFGVMTAEGADYAIFITSGIYTTEALQFAEGKPLELVDGGQFAIMMREYQKKLSQALEMPSLQVETQTPSKPDCPICHGPMILRRAKQGDNVGNEFWGCTKYPSCRGIRNLC